MTKQKKQWVIAGFGSLLVICIGLLPAFIKARSTSAANACVNNLRQIDAAKNQWALEHKKTSQDTPTWDDIRPYFPGRLSNSIPTCRDGGTYTIGQVGEPPRCSLGIGDYKFLHELP